MTNSVWIFNMNTKLLILETTQQSWGDKIHESEIFLILEEISTQNYFDKLQKNVFVKSFNIILGFR